MEYTVEQLESVGGKYWQGGSKRRVYFNDLYEFAGVEMETYSTGNISSMTVNGETISNRAARKLSCELDLMKLWYDMDDHKFHWQAEDSDLARAIIANIKSRVS